MKKSDLGAAVAFALGLAWMLAATPASAMDCFECSCSSSCGQACYDSVFIPDCPECNLSTCGAWGTCIGSWGCEEAECENLSCTTTITGTSGGDTINGTSARECINGLAGNDTLDGGAGDDRINGGDGDDCLYGGAGWDCADGGPGSDTCSAEVEINCNP